MEGRLRRKRTERSSSQSTSVRGRFAVAMVVVFVFVLILSEILSSCFEWLGRVEEEGALLGLRSGSFVCLWRSGADDVKDDIKRMRCL